MNKPQSCRYCDGTLEAQKVSRLQRYNDEWVILENVPALVCSQCGEIYYTPQTHDHILDTLESSEPTRMTEVSVFDVGDSA